MRMASTAAASAPSLSPRPIQRAQARAAYSVVRTSSMARLRSGPAPVVPCGGAPTSWWASIARTLYDPGRLARGGVEGLPEVAGDQHPGRRDQGHEVADPEAHVDGGLRAAEDDPVAEDQHERGDPDHHRHLAGLPGQLVRAGNDPRQEERRGARGHQKPVERVEDLPRVGAVVEPDPGRIDRG